MADEKITTRLKGRLKHALGWATGDRRVEAAGKVEEDEGHEPTPGEEEKAEKRVRRAHGDIRD